MSEHRPTPPIDPEVAAELGLDDRARKRRWMLRLAQVAVAVAALVGVGLAVQQWRQEPPVRYRTAAVLRGSLEETVSATGTLEPVQTVSVAPEVSGRITAVHVDYNDAVEAGQLLVELDQTTLLARRTEARASLRSARAQVQQARATLAQARRTRERHERLGAYRAVAEQAVEEARTAVEQAQAGLANARAQVALAQATLSSLDTDLERTRIVSPIDGVVLRRACEPGQTVAATFQPPLLFELAPRLDRMRLHLNVDEADIGRVEVGQLVRFEVDAFPDDRFEGPLVQIRNAPVTVQNVVSYEVVIEVEETARQLRPGMTATAEILTDAREDVLLVPNDALRFTPEGREGGADRVWREGPDGPVAVAIDRGITDGRHTELRSDGLSEGDALLIDVERSE
jgi:HlyD family secretion protein